MSWDRVIVRCSNWAPHNSTNSTNSMKQSPWTGTSFISRPKIPVTLWSHKVHDRIHNSSPLFLIPIQTNPVYATYPVSLKSNLILSSHLPLDLPSCPFPTRFPTKTLYTFLFSQTRTIYTAHLIRLFLVIRISPNAGQKFGLFEPTWPLNTSGTLSGTQLLQQSAARMTEVSINLCF